MDHRVLRDYQRKGVEWLYENYKKGHGSILADEMGLGKTCQSIFFMEAVRESEQEAKILLICPLSVLQNWTEEIERFSDFAAEVYLLRGDSIERTRVIKELKRKTKFIVLTTYEMAILAADDGMTDIKWSLMIMDEAHRVKNSSSQLHQIIHRQFDIRHKVLLTGTPIQNNLNELFSLLVFIAGDHFTESQRCEFIETYCEVKTSEEVSSRLLQKLKPFLLRRSKSDVNLDLPPRTNVVLYHGLTGLQKSIYKGALQKNLTALLNSSSSLNNVLMQLRKCCLHPYLFNGVEPEPFSLGEHLIEASQKLVLLDKLLSHLHEKGHKVLIYSQFTSMLDIVQDYLTLRQYIYERLDGSVRSEERFLAISNFNSRQSSFVFLLSTKAGGVGLNLVAADTVIFMDSDFNPQNDLQAAARVHRIGQKRPVKIVNLVCRDSVEEIIFARAAEKLKLSSAVMETGQLQGDTTSKSEKPSSMTAEIVKFGVSSLLDATSDETDELEIDLEKLLGPSVDGEWRPLDSCNVGSGLQDEEESSISHETDIYNFEGSNYRLKLQDADEALSKLQKEMQLLKADAPRKRKPPSRRTEAMEFAPGSKKRRLPASTPEERLQMFIKERQQLWDESGYESLALPAVDEEDDVSSDVSDDLSDSISISYVFGDVTRPASDGQPRNHVIVHCVDDSGEWGIGGVFSAIKNRYPEPSQQYELAASMQDLALGDVHLIPVGGGSSDTHVALVVAQVRGRRGKAQDINTGYLDEAFSKLSVYCKKNSSAIHCARLGHNMKSFNWYGAERLLKKHFTTNAIPTYVYYYRRQEGETSRSLNPMAGDTARRSPPLGIPSTSTSNAPNLTCATVKNGESEIGLQTSLPNLYSDLSFVFSTSLSDEEFTLLRRYVIAFDGEVGERDPNITADRIYIVNKDNLKLPISTDDLKESIKQMKSLREILLVSS